jgi:histidine phosphotransfer protein HptB
MSSESPTPTPRGTGAGAPIRSEFAGDPDMVELVQVFVAEMPRRAEVLRSCISDGRLDDLKRAAHQLKGAGGGYGFDAVTQTAASLESGILRALESGGNADLEGLRKQVDDLIDVLRRVVV